MGEVLGLFWPPGVPKGVAGTPGDEKVSKRDKLDPPQGPSWEAKFGLFVDFVGLFSYCFFECRSGRLLGSNFKWIWEGFY